MCARHLGTVKHLPHIESTLLTETDYREVTKLQKSEVEKTMRISGIMAWAQLWPIFQVYRRDLAKNEWFS